MGGENKAKQSKTTVKSGGPFDTQCLICHVVFVPVEAMPLSPPTGRSSHLVGVVTGRTMADPYFSKMLPHVGAGPSPQPPSSLCLEPKKSDVLLS